MDRQFFILALAAALSVLLVIAAATDIRSRIISNRLNIAIAALAPLFWLANGLAPWPDMLLQIIFACIIFGLFTMIFATGMMGGGDVKLLGALALWLPWQPMMMLLLIMSVLGGVVTVITRSEEHTSELQSLMRISYAVFCLKKKNQ